MHWPLRIIRSLAAIPAGICCVYLLVYAAGEYLFNFGFAYWPMLTAVSVIFLMTGGAAAGWVAGWKPMYFGAAVGMFFMFAQIVTRLNSYATNPLWFDVTLFILTIPATIAGAYLSSLLLRTQNAIGAMIDNAPETVDV